MTGENSPKRIAVGLAAGAVVAATLWYFDAIVPDRTEEKGKARTAETEENTAEQTPTITVRYERNYIPAEIMRNVVRYDTTPQPEPKTKKEYTPLEATLPQHQRPVSFSDSRRPNPGLPPTRSDAGSMGYRTTRYNRRINLV